MCVCLECDIVKCYIHYEYISQEISLGEECLHKNRRSVNVPDLTQ